MKFQRSNRASALIIILVAVVMVTILCVAFLNFAGIERRSSRLALNSTIAGSLASVGADAALAKLKYATETGMQKGKLWASEPGRIRIFPADNLSAYEDVQLFSALPGPDVPGAADINSVDLNKPSYQGRHPIVEPVSSGGEVPMKVGWIDLLADPGSPASRSNPLIGRVAYWVDDESCKININVADGSKKDTAQSYGFGTPSEVTLEALRKPDGSHLSNAQAAKISEYAWSSGFNSAAEVTRAGLNGEVTEEFFEKNKFVLTHYSKAPEISFTGDPKIYLFPAVRLSSNGASAGGLVRSWLTNAYGVALDSGLTNYLSSSGSTDAKRIAITDPINFVYPTSRQIEAALPGKAPFYQFGRHYYLDSAQLLATSPTGTNPENYIFAKRIAEAIKGMNSLQGAFTWPVFSGSAAGGFADKYNDRQIDSLALQILDIGTRAAMGDEARGGNLPSLVTTGMLSGKNAIGLGRTPKFTEFTVSFDAVRTATLPTGSGPPPRVANIPALQIDPKVEFWFPSQFEGMPWDERFGGYWRLGQNGNNYMLNPVEQVFSGASALGGSWMDNLFQITGIDLGGLSFTSTDPDPRHAIYHPYRNGRGGSSNSQPSGNRRPPFAFATASTSGTVWRPGEYHGVPATDRGSVSLYGPNDPAMTAFPVSGGIVLWTQAGGAGAINGNWDVAPLDSLRGDYRTTSGEPSYIYTSEPPMSIRTELKEAVIPVPAGFSIPLPAIEHVWHGYVKDPLVNKFPGDWIVSDTDADATLKTSGATAYSYQDGANPGFLASQGGDPLSVWMPRLDVNYPKQSRFPSIGALNYVRTGVAPDDVTVPLPQQKGTPWRSLSLTPASAPGQATLKGRYPDWAMLDLFTVPFLPQLPFRVGEAAPPKRRLTSGGATEGKININNPAVPYPFSQTMSQVERDQFPKRTAPMEALFYKVRVNQGYDAADVPVYATLGDSEVSTLVSAIQNRVMAGGPFVLPGQMADVSEVDTYTYKGVAEEAQSRNDLLKQVIGAATTQSNVFSIWVVARSVKKKAANTRFGEFEAGDMVTAEVRRRYVVERFIDLGADGVPGNANNPGTDGVVGTEDDPVDPKYHPAMKPPFPYLWRIVSMEEIQR
ncbi:hypothetical protein TSACC_3261 [Terrimicrobium sacchariphilum]|uniref:Verru_Chthon cassette protein A n=1 Tax=Terrimicrobium sacchariphilum TaxID=690879 RepID=A0A146GEY7_TERSA|nr:hypothetical protein [Terrimicrobium sacchariphilum]GAT35197.1 hypothetical protein TSACC_3261 [Terrimicrobium sacchariphilum]